MALEVLLGLLIIFLLAYLITRKTYSAKIHGLHAIPMVSPWIPFFGNAHLLHNAKTHIVLTKWARKYGSIFRMQLFKEDIIVLNDFASIYEALVVKGRDFAGRPPMYRTEIAQRNRHSVVWQTYTDKLVFLRKEVLRSLRMYGTGLENLEHKCRPDIELMLKRFSEAKGQPIDPWNIIYDAVCNVMLSFTLGTRPDLTSTSVQYIKHMNTLFNDTFGAGRALRLDFLPFLYLLRDDCHCRHQEALKLRDAFWEEEFAKLKFQEDNHDCVVKHLLSFLEDDKEKKTEPNGINGISTSSLKSGGSKHGVDLNLTTIKEVFTNLILAGTDTTATALTCLLLLFVHHPHIQIRLWEEISAAIGNGRLPCLADREKLPYMEATLLELLRYISHVPLAVPHYTMCDTSVLGKPVPANTTVYINLWSLHHDESVWPNPWTFNPSRFLDSDGKLLPSSHENRRRLMPFGAGRRVCLGETLAKNRLFLFATSLVQNFFFQAEDEKNLPEVDPQAYEMGLVLHPKPFRLQAIRRQCKLKCSL